LNDEVQVKTRKLRKASEKLRQAKSEIKDLQAEFQTVRDELLETIRNLKKQMKLKELIITQFIPPEFREQFDDVAVGGRAVWNEEEERWFIPKINPLNPSTNAAFSVGPFQTSDEKLLRPETEYARVQRVKDPTNIRFRSQNIIDLELDRRIRLNQIHSGSGQISSKVSEILKMKIGDGSLNKIRPERDFPNNPYLHYRPKTSAKS
jgi:kinesin family protein 3/17